MSDEFKHAITKSGMPNRRVGRPTKLTKKTQEKIIEFLRNGAYVETAALAAGVAKATFYNWLKEGNKEKEQKIDGIYSRFLDAIDEASAKAEVADVLRITQAAQNGIWQASAWRLERKFPEKWGKSDKLEMTGKNGGPIDVRTVTIDVSKLSTEHLKALKEAMPKQIESGDENY